MIKKPVLLAFILFTLNLSVAWRLFPIEFTQHMSSNEGFFMSLSKFMLEHWSDASWCPLWFNGSPIENLYSPLLQIMSAVFAAVTHRSTALGFHWLIAFFYCLGPVLLFCFAWKMSRLLYPSFLAALLYSLSSPSVVFPAVRADIGGWFNPRRLHTLVFYGEGAHNVALSLFPLALLCAYLALTRRQVRWYVATGILAGVMVLINAFAAVDLILGFGMLIAVQPADRMLRGLGTLAGIGAVAYAWISPLMPPALIRAIRSNSMLVGGYYQYTGRVIGIILLVVAGAGIVWFLTRRLSSPFDRFALLFAYVFFAIPGLAHFAKIALLPQPERYHLEMEMGVCLALIFTLRHLFLRSRTSLVTGFVGVLIGLMLAQFIVYRTFARGLIQRIDVSRTIEYKTAKWIAGNLPGERVMASGDVGFWFNLFADNPQLSSAADPFSPNWMIQVATYAIYFTEEAKPAITWLKAFGCRAVSVPGPNSHEEYHPFRNPKKFEGVLPLLWHEEDDSIYAVPQRSKSLAHVVPETAIVHRVPVNGIDLEEVDRFVTAMEDPALPLAELSWQGSSHGHVSAPLQTGQAIALQVTYDPGWVATVGGNPVPITRDGIGLMTLHPNCSGPCEVTLEFDGGLERKACRILSLLIMLSIIGLAGFRIRYKASSYSKDNGNAAI